MSYTQFQYPRNKEDKTCEDVLDNEECLRFKQQGLCEKVNDGMRDLTLFCKSTCGLCGTHILLLISLILFNELSYVQYILM